MNKLQWNFNRMSFIFIQENAYENVVWKMAAILSRPQCVKLHAMLPSSHYQDDCVSTLNSLRPRLNRRPFADDIFKCIFLNENEWISPRISLKFVPKVRINNIPPLVQIMAWRRPGVKPLSEAMVVRLPTCICVTRPQWVRSCSQVFAAHVKIGNP